MRVALCQRSSVVGDVEANLAKALSDLDRVGPDCDLALFPELYLAGYNARDRHAELALTPDHPVLAKLKDKARQHDVHVIIGGPRRSHVRGVTHNAAFHVPPQGDVQAYDKVHLPNFNVFEEGLYFGAGKRGLLVDGPENTKIGIVICYDLFFPEITKDLALRGADILACISASPVTSQPYFEAVLPARALETTSFLLYCNLVGVQDHLTFWGGSRAYDPLGKQIADAPVGSEAVVTCELDLDLVALARKKRPVLRDTRMFSVD